MISDKHKGVALHHLSRKKKEADILGKLKEEGLSHEDAKDTLDYARLIEEAKDPQWKAPVRRRLDPFAVLGLAFSVLFPFLGVLLSYISLKRIAKDKKLGGEGFARMGLVLGILDSLIIILIVLAKMLSKGN